MPASFRLPKPLASFAARILILLVGIGVFPLIGLGLMHDYYTKQMLAKLNEDRVKGRMDEALQRISLFINERFGELEMLADYPPLKVKLAPDLPPAAEDMTQALIEYQADQSALYGIVLVDNGGHVAAGFPPRLGGHGVDWSANEERLPFGTLYQDRDRGILGPVLLEGIQGQTLFLFQRVYLDPERRLPIGIVSIHLPVEALLGLMGESSDEALLPHLLSPGKKYYPEFSEGGASPAKVVASAPLLEGWELVMTVDENRLAAPIAQLRQTLAWMIGATLIGILAVIGVFYRSSARRIRKLTEGAEAIAHGDLRWRLEDRGNDELSALSGAFNRMAEQLRTLIDSTVQSEKMASLGKLATTIAHEVRNPLASIKTGVQVVEENLKDEEQAKILRNVIAEIDRLNRVASDLLGFARPVPTRSENAAVHEIVERVRNIVDRQAAKHDIRVSAEIDPGLTIRVDPNQMQQVLMNLVLNAIHAMPRGGELTFRAHLHDHRIVIDVSDTGEGMAPDTIERVMRPFVSSRHDGTGIGLSVSHQLVERNQGRMEIRSTPRQGTTVSLSFPAT